MGLILTILCNLLFVPAFYDYCSAWAQVGATILVLRFGPKMNTKVAFNTHHHTKLVDQFQTFLILILYFSISIKTDIQNTERLVGATYNTKVSCYGMDPKRKQTNHYKLCKHK